MRVLDPPDKLSIEEAPKRTSSIESSPDKSIDRTFRAVFELPPARRGKKEGKSKPSRTYRNPIFLAREWQKTLETGKYSSQADLARKMGFSRARVTQVLRLLKLAPEVVNAISVLGDPLPLPMATERSLRQLVNLPKTKQMESLKELLRAPIIEKKQSIS